MKQLPIEAIVTYPLPGMNLPGSLTFSPDGTWLSYLHSSDGSLVRQLYGLHLETGETHKLADASAIGTTEENVSLAEALRRERLRQRELGITQYRWNQHGQLLIPLPAGLYIVDEPGGDLRLLLATDEAPALDAKFSPNGRFVSYVQDAELYRIAADGGTPRQLTSGARGSGKTNGLAEYIAQEEMGRSSGYWWSPDSQHIAYAEVDETHIPVYRIMHQGKDDTGDGAQEDHRYPFAGAANAIVRLAVIAADGGEPRWLDLGADTDIYLARVNWVENGRLLVQRLNRAQSQLDLLLFDVATGNGRLLLSESTDVWINLHHICQPIPALNGFLWASERSGFRHLAIIGWDGTVIRPLTSGDWQVDAVVGVDEASQTVYFTATQASPTEKHLYAVSWNDGSLRQLTDGAGMHDVTLNKAKTRFSDTFSNTHMPPTITVRELANGRMQHTLHQTADPRVAELDLTPPQIVTLPNRHGNTLYGAIYRPPARFGDGPFPTIVSVYGGPHAQRVTNQWLLTVDMRAQYLSQQGFLVFKLDNRGSARRGLAFEAPIQHDMGNVEVQDQVDGVNWLVAEGLTDPQHVGIYGWSYGGYMAAMCLARAAGTFHVAVAGAPVTHWDGYDTCYTERYMGTPQSNPDGYATSSVMTHLDALRGKLLLVHGLIDENVHFRHTARLINGLIRAKRPYDLLLFPNERHMPRGLADRIYMEERIRDYFVEYLRGGVAPLAND